MLSIIIKYANHLFIVEIYIARVKQLCVWMNGLIA